MPHTSHAVQLLISSPNVRRVRTCQPRLCSTCQRRPVMRGACDIQRTQASSSPTWSSSGSSRSSSTGMLGGRMSSRERMIASLFRASRLVAVLPKPSREPPDEVCERFPCGFRCCTPEDGLCGVGGFVGARGQVLRRRRVLRVDVDPDAVFIRSTVAGLPLAGEGLPSRAGVEGAERDSPADVRPAAWRRRHVQIGVVNIEAVRVTVLAISPTSDSACGRVRARM